MKKKSMAMLLVLALIVTMIPAGAFAAVEEVAEPIEVTELISSENLQHNFVKVTANGSSLTVEVETPIKAEVVSIGTRSVEPNTKNAWAGRMFPTEKDGYYTFTGNIYTYGKYAVKDGDHVLYMTMYPDGEDNKDSSYIFYKNCNIRVKYGQFSILQYETITEQNEKMAAKGAKYKKSRFTDKKLNDIKGLLFKDPVTKKTASVTDKKAAYLKKVAKAVTKGAETDYEKVLKIYEYVAENFYYDDVAFSTGTKQYTDPYKNLYNLRNKKKSANSTSDGKVATVCTGMGGIVVALARQLDIPARLVNGHHVGLGSQQYNNWSTEPDPEKVDHWWAEVYVDGRWIVVDPTPGNSNKWNRSKGTWTKTGITNYIYFDPTPEQLATSHVTYTIRGKDLK